MMNLSRYLTTSRKWTFTCRPLIRFSHFSTSSSSSLRPFSKILIANRGEIACRIQKTAHALGIQTVAIYSEADAKAQHVAMANESYCIGPAPVSESYLKADKILEIALQAGAEAIHPGYGFLSENASFAKACLDKNIEFIGPPIAAIEAMGSKSASKDIMIAAGVPVTPGYHGADQSLDLLQSEAKKMGYPVMIKAVLGGGGKGMRIVDEEKDLIEAIDACKREAISSFGDDRVLIEKYLRTPRHIELQIFADKFGNTCHLFERDCSVQRRHQKVLEEAPAPGMTLELREKMGNAAILAAKAVEYVGAGTVEFMLDEDDSFYFMEMNTRLQVEHPVTEMITRQDLVELQLQVASGAPLPFAQSDLVIHGHAIEARVYAENPYNHFLPATGKLAYLKFPHENHVRVDTGVTQGDQVSIYYDPMIAKLIVWGENRSKALELLVRSLQQFQIAGVPTNIEFLTRNASHPEFIAGQVNTSFLDVYGEELTTPFESIPTHGYAIGALIVELSERQPGGSVWNTPSTAGFRTIQGSLERSITLQESSSSSSRKEDTREECTIELQYKSSNAFDLKLEESKTGAPLLLSASGTLDEVNQRFDIQIDAKVYRGNYVMLHNQLVVFITNDPTILQTQYHFELPSPSFVGQTSSAVSLSNEKGIMTPMPGKVIKVFVRADDEVSAGEPLLILEAMKMEHVIKAPRDVKVEQVYFQVGDFVDDGTILVDFHVTQDDVQ